MDELSGLEKYPVGIVPETAWQPQSFSLVTTEKQNDKPERRGNNLRLSELNKCVNFSTLQLCVLYYFYFVSEIIAQHKWGQWDKYVNHVPGCFMRLTPFFFFHPSFPYLLRADPVLRHWEHSSQQKRQQFISSWRSCSRWQRATDIFRKW